MVISHETSIEKNKTLLLFYLLVSVLERENNEFDEMPNKLRRAEAAIGKLKDYNSVTETPMNLILFDFAISHLARIVRILLIPGGHGLLVGMGGSGRQSLTRLAAHVAQTQLIQFDNHLDTVEMSGRKI